MLRQRNPELMSEILLMQRRNAESAEEEDGQQEMWLTCALSVMVSACCGLRSDSTSVGSLSQGSWTPGPPAFKKPTNMSAESDGSSQYVAAIKATDSNVNIILLNESVSDSEMRGGCYTSPTNTYRETRSQPEAETSLSILAHTNCSRSDISCVPSLFIF